LCPGCRFVQIGTLVEGRLGPGHHRPSGDVQRLVIQKARLTLGAFRTTNRGPSVWNLDSDRQGHNWTTTCVASLSDSPACQGRSGQGTHRSRGQRTRPATPVPPGMLERQGRNGPPRGSLPAGGNHHHRGNRGSGKRGQPTGQGSPSSRTGPDWRAEQPDTPSPGRTAKRGRATRPTWAGAREPMTPSARPSRERCKLRQPETTRSGW